MTEEKFYRWSIFLLGITIGAMITSAVLSGSEPEIKPLSAAQLLASQNDCIESGMKPMSVWYNDAVLWVTCVPKSEDL